MTMFGYTAADFDGTITAFNRRLHPDDLTRVSEALRACIDLVGDFEAEYRVVRPDGETRWVQARRSEEHTSELQSRQYLVCRLLLEKKKPLYCSPPHPTAVQLSST